MICELFSHRKGMVNAGHPPMNGAFKKLHPSLSPIRLVRWPYLKLHGTYRHIGTVYATMYLGQFTLLPFCSHQNSWPVPKIWVLRLGDISAATSISIHFACLFVRSHFLWLKLDIYKLNPYFYVANNLDSPFLLLKFTISFDRDRLTLPKSRSNP